MHELLKKVFLVSDKATPTGSNGLVDFNATGDKMILTPVAPIEIYRWGFIVKTAMDPDAGGFVIALDHRTTVGSDSGRTEKATITRADAETVAAGAMVYNDVVLAVAESEVTGLSSTTNKVNVGPAGPLVVDVGEEAVIEVTNAVGAASDGYVFIEYVQHPFDTSEGTKETS